MDTPTKQQLLAEVIKSLEDIQGETDIRVRDQRNNFIRGMLTIIKELI